MTTAVVPSAEAVSFLKRYQGEIKVVAEQLKGYLDKAFARYAGDGLVQLAVMVRDAVEKGALHGKRREFLLNSYRWLRSRATAKEVYHKEVELFLEDCLRADQFQKTSAAAAPRSEVVARLELAFSGIGHAIAKKKPAQAGKEKKGTVRLSWTGFATQQEDAEVSWLNGLLAVKSLRGTAAHSFSVYGRLPEAEPQLFAHQVVRELAQWRSVPIPNFTCPKRQAESGPPPMLNWCEPEQRPAADEDFPAWMFKAQESKLPTDAELAYFDSESSLGVSVDRLLAIASRIDQDQEQAARHRKEKGALAPEERAVMALGKELARLANHPLDRIAEIFRELAENRPAKTKSPRECADNTSALAFLLEQVTER
jgi:hypothetical protein